MIDFTKIAHGVQITMKDGQKLKVVGAYASVDGIVIRAKPDPAGLYERNCPLTDIADISAEEETPSGPVA